MAKFLDVKLKGEKGMSDDEVESVLDKVMVLFRYVYMCVCDIVSEDGTTLLVFCSSEIFKSFFVLCGENIKISKYRTD